MSKSDKHDELIDMLCLDLEPVKKCRAPMHCAITWFFSGLLSVIILSALMSFRHDLSEKLMEPWFLFEMGLILSLSFCAALASAHLRVPDGDNRFILRLTFLLFLFVVMIIGREMFIHDFTLSALTFSSCMIDAFFTGSLPVIFMMLMMREQKTTRPILCGFLNAVAAGSIGYLGLRLSCGSDAVNHVCFYHVIPYVSLGIIVGVLARKLYRW